MRWMMLIVGLQGLVIMLEKGDKRKAAAATISALCALCLLARSKGSLLYTGAGGLQRYLEDKGLSVVDLGLAMVAYELIGFCIMLCFWAGCFIVQPIKCGLLQPLGTLISICREIFGSGLLDKAEGLYTEVLGRIQQKFDIVAKRLGIDAMRFSSSYAESAVCRSVLKPLLFPLKLYLVFACIMAYKRVIGAPLPPLGTQLAA
mmetsp:Transcript_19859/g.31084  ORF Transcript_19859/g.31084 Transcript_19859/m.31084 type:complete len:203 (+) Transcript_19859:124-732(+)